MKHVKSFAWFIAGLLLVVPATHVPQLIDIQIGVWMWVVDLARPNPLLLFGSFYYWPVLFVLTGWYWIWRFMRWVFDDEGPLPRFFWTLVVLWSPVWIIPTVTILSLVGWFACFYKAHLVYQEEQ